MLRLVALLVWANLAWAAGTAAELGRQIAQLELDPAECYRVREISLSREDARFYFTDGYLIFSKPVRGRVIAAAFTSDVEGGDAELLVLPPSRSERRSLAAYTDSPNLDEHFSAAVLVFADDSYERLLEQIRQNPFNRQTPDLGSALSIQWTPVVRNIAGSHQVRLMLDLLSGSPAGRGFFAAVLNGKRLGNFDVSYDPRSPEQILLGQVNSRDNRTFFDIWSSFEARSSRGRPVEPALDARLSDYQIRATIHPDLGLQAQTRVRVTCLRGPLRVLPFDIATQMRVTGAQVDGHPAEVFSVDSMRSDLVRHSGDRLILVLPPEPLQPGREYEFVFEQAGHVIRDTGNRVYYVGARSNWYPGYGLQYSNFDLSFRYPRGLSLVTAGTIVEDRADGEWEVTRRTIATPVRMAGFNLGQYESVRVERQEFAVEVFANRNVERALEPRVHDILPLPPQIPPPRVRRPEVLSVPVDPPFSGPAARLRPLASQVMGALEFMSARFGPPPLRQLRVSPIPGAFGQGFPGLVYLSTLSYLSPGGKVLSSLNERQQVFFSEILQAHETAHQWWGNMVTTAGYHDHWLMEALANYSALLFLEKQKGGRSLASVLDGYRQDLLLKTTNGQTIESVGPIVMGTRLESSQEPRAWRIITYEKGSWILHMLRRLMGDDRFWAMLSQLLERYRGRTITTEEFRRTAAEFLPPGSHDRTLENFFEQWVYGTGLPHIQLTYDVRGKGRSLNLMGKLTQGEVDDDFTAAVPIQIQFRSGKPLTRWIRSGSEPVSFSVRLTEPPLRVLLDPEWSVLRR